MKTARVVRWTTGLGAHILDVDIDIDHYLSMTIKTCCSCR